jgi:hypothetical protein
VLVPVQVLVPVLVLVLVPVLVLVSRVLVLVRFSHKDGYQVAADNHDFMKLANNN